MSSISGRGREIAETVAELEGVVNDLTRLAKERDEFRIKESVLSSVTKQALESGELKTGMKALYNSTLSALERMMTQTEIINKCGSKNAANYLRKKVEVFEIKLSKIGTEPTRIRDLLDLIKEIGLIEETVNSVSKAVLEVLKTDLDRLKYLLR